MTNNDALPAAEQQSGAQVTNDAKLSDDAAPAMLVTKISDVLAKPTLKNEQKRAISDAAVALEDCLAGLGLSGFTVALVPVQDSECVTTIRMKASLDQTGTMRSAIEDAAAGLGLSVQMNGDYCEIFKASL